MGCNDYFMEEEANRLGSLFSWVVEKYINVPKNDTTIRKIAKDCMKTFEAVTGKKNWNIEVTFDADTPTSLSILLIDSDGNDTFEFNFLTRVVYDANSLKDYTCSCGKKNAVDVEPNCVCPEYDVEKIVDPGMEEEPIL